MKNPAKLTSTARAVLAIIRHRVNTGCSVMPSNREISEKLGFRSPSTPTDAINLLAATGMITLESYANCRRVTLCETGQQLVSANWMRAHSRLHGNWREYPECETYKKETSLAAKREAEKARIETLRTGRVTPCARCAVRSDHHDSLGCAQFVERVAA